MASSVMFQLSSMVRGYHGYQYIWDVAVGETLQCHCEVGSICSERQIGQYYCWTHTKSFHACVHCFYNGVGISVVKLQAFGAILLTYTSRRPRDPL